MIVCLWFLIVSIMGCVCQCILFLARKIVFLMRWYVEMCFFPFFCIFLGKNPPCVVVRFVRVGGGGALQVSCILFEISWTS